MVGGSLLKSGAEEFKVKGQDAITISLQKDSSDSDNNSVTFHPDFVHQQFGDSEEIFGYKNPKVSINYRGSDLQLYLEFSHGGVISDKFSDIKPDDVMGKIKEFIPWTPFESQEKMNSAPVTPPPGEMIHQYSRDDGNRQFRVFKVTEGGGVCERVQSLAIWLIDAASYTDKDDPKWTYYLLQILVFPPFQNDGHGVSLLDSISTDLSSRSNVVDISVEDPSDNFIRLRDYLDCVNCSKLDGFSKEKLSDGFSEDMVKQANGKYKIGKNQVRRVYEILRLKSLDPSDKGEMKKYRLDVKRRLNIPYQKTKRDEARMAAAMHEMMESSAGNSSHAVSTPVSDEDRMNQLQKEYESVLEEYRAVINRLKTYAA